VFVRKIYIKNDKEDLRFSRFIRPRSVSSELLSERIIIIPVTLKDRTRILESIPV
jgi:hypothetical protein